MRRDNRHAWRILNAQGETERLGYASQAGAQAVADVMNRTGDNMMNDSDPEVRYQIKGVKRGSAFHVAGFETEAEAVDAAGDETDFERVIVVDEHEWNRRLDADATGILWDSAAVPE